MSFTIAKLDTSAFYEGDTPMSEHAWQHSLVGYLESVLKWLYHQEGWFVTGNLDTINDKITHPVAPDVMFFNNVTLTEAEIKDLSIWRIELPHRPAPSVIFEISSKGTWKEDVNQKPEIYRLLEAKEYFAFDPKQHWGKKTPIRLKGWRYEGETIFEIQLDNGRLWSNELNCWLVPDGSCLRLYNKDDSLLLTKDEAILAKLQERGITLEDLGL